MRELQDEVPGHLHRKKVQDLDLFSEGDADLIFVELNVQGAAVFVMFPHLFAVRGFQALDAKEGPRATHASHSQYRILIVFTKSRVRLNAVDEFARYVSDGS